MSAATAAREDQWLEVNQRQLGAALDAVRRRVTRYLGGGEEEPAEGEDQRLAGADWQRRSALDRVCRSFALSPFERDVLLLCAGVELDGRLAGLCAEASGDPRRVQPTFGLALAALGEPHWSALAPVAPLRKWRLVELAGGETLTTSPLTIDERILHFLTGVSYRDDRLSGIVEVVPRPPFLAERHRRTAERLAALWSGTGADEMWPAIHLAGPDQGAKAAICAAACAALGITALAIRGGDVPASASERFALARLCEREMALAGGVLLIDVGDGRGEDERLGRVAAFASEVAWPVVIAAGDPAPIGERATLRLEVDPPSAGEQAALWRHALGIDGARFDGQIERAVAQFRLDSTGIRAAAETAKARFAAGTDPADALWDSCRKVARLDLDDLAQRIDAVATWQDLVLPAPQLRLLGEIAVHVRRRTTVYEAWGFAAKGSRGLGISALFTGASGTGKTMAAEVLANELSLDLFRIDLSQVVSKYIGETEKNLSRIFDTAEVSGAILLFDEADALFGKRSEVKDSHDRYANIEVSYLLQRMEAYRGLAILTTNLKDALDPAFLRRIRFIVQFPFPDAALRAEIWRRIFPAETPTEGLDAAALARLQIAGGSIRNIAINAAFLAAEEGTPVAMGHLVRAARSEYAKLEKPLSAAELGERR